MIARLWSGRVPHTKADDYVSLMRSLALPDYLSTPGNLGAWCLRREQADAVHVQMLSFWDDLDAIRRFAGPDPELAKYYDFDADFLLERLPNVVHWELLGPFTTET